MHFYIYLYSYNCPLLVSANYYCSEFGKAAVVGAYKYTVFR